MASVAADGEGLLQKRQLGDSLLDGLLGVDEQADWVGGVLLANVDALLLRGFRQVDHFEAREQIVGKVFPDVSLVQY